MKQKQVHKSNWLVMMLLLVMAILMPYGGGYGHKLLVNRQRVTEKQAILTSSQKLRNWRGSAIRWKQFYLRKDIR